MNYHDNRGATRSPARRGADIALGLTFAALLLHGCDAPASAASLSRSIEVDASPTTVWSVVGPFCAIKDWHPVVGSCTETSTKAPTRTLVTKDGKTTFVEPEVARNESEHFYSYSFKSSPFPVTHYIGTIWVVAADKGRSTILWTGSYTPFPGKEKEADAAFAGVYDAGLVALKNRFAR